MTRENPSQLNTTDKDLASPPHWVGLFDVAERYVYVAVAVLLLSGAVATIAYALYSAIEQTRSRMGFLSAIFSLINDLLLVLIIMEVLRTVGGFIRKHEPVGVADLIPFLVIGAISATRRILAIGANVSIKESHNVDQAAGEVGKAGSNVVVQAASETHLDPEFFRQAMVELGVNGLLIIVITLALLLIRRNKVVWHGAAQT